MFTSNRDINFLKERARQIRRDIVSMLCKAGSGHPGGSLSSADIVTALYFAVMKHDPANPKWEDADRFILSKGHCCPVLYAALAETGYFDVKELDSLRKLGSILQGHPSNRYTPGVAISSGSLGQGLSVGVGAALAGKLDNKDYRVYTLHGDGEMNEGQIWEAAMAAPHYKLDNLCAILDYNHLQIDGCIEEVMDTTSLPDKWRAFRWNVIEANAHDIASLLEAFDKAKAHKGAPSIVVAHSTKGKGVSFMENQVGWHGKAPSEEEASKALEELCG